MFIEFVIKRELALKLRKLSSTNLVFNNKSNLFALLNFSKINFTKPSLLSFSDKIFPFLVLSNGALVLVDFSFSKEGRGALLFEDLYGL